MIPKTSVGKFREIRITFFCYMLRNFNKVFQKSPKFRKKSLQIWEIRHFKLQLKSLKKMCDFNFLKILIVIQMFFENLQENFSQGNNK